MQDHAGLCEVLDALGWEREEHVTGAIDYESPERDKQIRMVPDLPDKARCVCIRSGRRGGFDKELTIQEAKAWAYGMKRRNGRTVGMWELLITISVGGMMGSYGGEAYAVKVPTAGICQQLETALKRLPSELDGTLNIVVGPCREAKAPAEGSHG